MERSKRITTLGVFAASLVFVFLFISDNATASLFSRTLTFGELSSELKTPDKLAKYMWRHFSYVEDRRAFGKDEYWQSPQEFYTNRKGDCEDFALFAKEILSANGIQSFLLNVYGKNFAHTVCVFQEDGKFHVIDGTKVKRYGAKDLNDLSKKIHPSWEKSAIVGPSKETEGRGQILKSFEKRVESSKGFSLFA